MKRGRFTEEQIIHTLRRGEAREPGKEIIRTENGHIEAFNRRFRDECLDLIYSLQ
jgi:rubrerythrin